ncbi:hypothetical protein SAMN05216436_106124 [bacterium A37T11]|nr:hypothetical protein SAMN05216436_106124 [bacterium A37T11]
MHKAARKSPRLKIKVMDRIVLEVDDIAARKWQTAPASKKAKLAESIAHLINSSLKKNDDDFWDFVDRINQKAADNGLTEDKLEQLLNEG